MLAANFSKLNNPRSETYSEIYLGASIIPPQVCIV